MRTLRLVLGDQVSDRLSALTDLDPVRGTVLMAEVRAEATYVRRHKQKIALIFAAMPDLGADGACNGRCTRCTLFQGVLRILDADPSSTDPENA